MKLFIKSIIWLFGALIALILILAIVSLKPLDTRPVNEYPEVSRTLSHLDSVEMDAEKSDTLLAAWTAVNITPDHPIDMAGYGPRGPYRSVHDSLYARIMLFDNQKVKAVMISVDLLMFPRLLKHRLEDALSAQGFSKEMVFFMATHTHHGFGNWEQSPIGEFAFGDFDQQNMVAMVNKILAGIEQADQLKMPVQTSFSRVDAHELVMNRLAHEKGTKDPFLRIVQLKNNAGHTAALVSFSGHATNLDADEWTLSRDYPGVIIDQLEETGAFDFVMFGAGMVGSHNIDIDLPKGHQRAGRAGELLAEKIMSDTSATHFQQDGTLGGLDAEIDLPASQLRIEGRIAIRNWIFKTAFAPLEANIRALRIGHTLFIGMPCDYSGELSVNRQLDAYASDRGLNLMITSFNGNYVGYITEDRHYFTCNHDEVKTLNWVGPGMGSYFTDVIAKVIDASE